nr:Chain A, Endoglucanase [Perinereis brevicirris]4ZG8_B Chain B, Endoglucanase [Perinereis brevicirris]4ZH5_A Chain A, Endoglucanase [Perinereis brevicirris]4ZH5_B Chain B, Endoglucanase [Perinereis brevicirris]
AQYNYREVLQKSILFYAAQRSGQLPGNNPIDWRDDSALDDQGNGGEDLTGGWYDAGDHVKFGLPMAWTATTLIWGMIDLANGYGGDRNDAMQSVRWALDYFMKCHVSDNELYGQVGDGHADHAYWGRPEEMTMDRPAWSLTPSAPGSDLAGETAAALAAGSILFSDSDASYANQLLDHARTIYDFAYNNRGIYSESIPNAADFYRSSAYEDELCWGALWLYRATGEQDYMDKANEFLPQGRPWAFSWDSKEAGSLVLLTSFGNSNARAQLEDFLQSWFPGGDIHYTPLGLAWRDTWGSLRYSANSAFIALLAAEEGVLTSQARTFARAQLDYMLGSTGRSFVVGFGTNPPLRPHHRAASCPDMPASCGWDQASDPAPNPQVLDGALVGGPDDQDNYNDDRQDYISNEVACDYNAGFQGALAGILQL